MPFTAVNAATIEAPPYCKNTEFTISRRNVWNRLFSAEGLPAALISPHSFLERGTEIPSTKLDPVPNSLISPNTQAAAVDSTLARLAPNTPQSSPYRNHKSNMIFPPPMITIITVIDLFFPSSRRNQNGIYSRIFGREPAIVTAI